MLSCLIGIIATYVQVYLILLLGGAEFSILLYCHHLGPSLPFVEVLTVFIHSSPELGDHLYDHYFYSLLDKLLIPNSQCIFFWEFDLVFLFV